MCIAISKPSGVALPEYNILKNCWDNNNDGAGFAFAYNGRVFIKKGFMTFNDFMTALEACDKRYELNKCGMLLHFRIATHGARDASMTHPFPIVDDEGALKKIEYISDYAVIHNGIITLTSSATYKSNGLSDTALFVKDYLTKISQNKAWLRKACNIELIEKLIDSKMAIIDHYGNIKMTSGFIEDNGVYYSNTSYKDSYVKYTYYSGGSYSKKYTPKNSKSYLYNYDDNNYNYYDKYDSYDDAILSRMDDSATISGQRIGLMKLHIGDNIECDNSYSDKITNDGYDYYVDIYNNLYMASSGLEDDEKEFVYMGSCDVYDSNFKEVNYVRSIWANPSQFDSIYCSEEYNLDGEDDEPSYLDDTDINCGIHDATNYNITF